MNLTWQERRAAARDYFRKSGYELRYYPAPGGKKASFALIAPGGGYATVCTAIEGEPFAKELNKRGYSAFIVYYRVKKEARHPAPLDDMARALKEILDNAEKWNVRTEGFSVWGSSAGGHLAACFGTESIGYVRYGLPKPAAMVLVYPVITMGRHTHKGSRNNLLGKNASPETRERLSVENLVTGQYPSTYIWNTLEDKTVPPVNGQLFAEAAEKAGIVYQYRQYQTGAHGCGLAKGLECESWFDEAVAFWQAQIIKETTE